MNLLSWVVFGLLHFREKLPLTRRFRFDAFGGFYTDPKSGDAVCPNCLGDGRVVHMMRHDNGARMCLACRTACRGKPDKQG
ncbi:MAG: hypothetical protein WCQ16_13205 [Verrucomicrobiae bacterium]